MLPYRGHGGGVLAATFSADGTRLLALGNDAIARTWDARRHPEAYLIRCEGAWQAAFSCDGRYLAVAGTRFPDNRRGLIVWETETVREVARFGLDGEDMQSVALSPDGRLVAAATDINNTDGAVRIRDVSAGQVVRNRTWPHFAGQHFAGWTVAASAAPGAPPLGPSLSMAGFFACLSWDLVELVGNLPAQGPAAPCDAVAWSADGKLIASGGQDRIVRVWDAATGKQLLALAGHNRTISAVAFSRDGKRLVSASGGIDRQFPLLGTPNPLNLPSDKPDEVPDVKVWDMTTGQEVRSFRLPGKGPGMALSPDGETVAVTFGGDARLNILRSFDLPSRGAQITKAWHTDPGGVVRLYRTETGEELAVLKGHTQSPWCVTFSPDGQRVVTSGADSTIKLWDAVSGEEIMTIGRHPGLVTSVTFSPDGLKIVSTSATGDVRIWDATPTRK
jgi:WD40 repeat protein